MTSKSFGKIFLAFIAVLWLVPAALWAASYVEETLSVPAGSDYGWTSFPDAPSSLGDVFLVVPFPRYAEDSVTGVWSLQANRHGEYEIRSLAGFKETIRAYPADIDGNGTRDLVITFIEKPVVSIYFGFPKSRDTDSPLYNEYELPLGTSPYTGAGDLNGDGLAEIVVTNKLEDGLPFLTILWAELSDAGEISYNSFDTLSIKRSTSGLKTTDFLFGNYNGDRLTDFVYAGSLYINRSNGEFESIDLPYLPEPFLILLGAADFDRDGLTELLFIRRGQKDSNLKEIVISGFEYETGFYEKLILQSSRFGYAFEFGEFTGDRYPDLAVYFSSTLDIFRGTPEGSFSQEPEKVMTPLAGDELIGPLDWNHDGLLDWLFLDPRKEIIVKVQQAPLYLDKTAEVGLDFEMAGHAAAVADFNNDGYPDIYIVNGSGLNALFAGNPEGVFHDVAEEAGVALANDGISCAWGDYNNDGFVDLFVAGMLYSDKLFHNNGDGTFSDSSRILGFNHPNQRVTSVCWGDVNNDGWLDLLLGNYDGADLLLYNISGRSFLERAPKPGDDQYKTESAVLVDVNLDGRLDFVTLNADGPTRLIMNTAGFCDSTANSGLNPDENYKKFGQTQTWGDFNGDNYPDLYITRAQDVDMLFLNRGKQSGPQFNLAFSGHHSGKYGRIAAAVADFDANSAPDLLIARSSRFGDFIASPGDLLFLGDPSKDHPLSSQIDLASTESESVPSENLLGLDRYIDSSLPVVGDFDRDGDLDLLFVNYLPDNPLSLFQGSPLPLSYMQNQSQVNSNLLVKLRRTNNQSLVGTRVVLNDGDKRYTQVVSGGFGRIQTGDLLLFSLGAAGTADSLTVYWPQGRVTTYRGPVYPGTLEIVDDRRGPVITALELPGLVPVETLLPSNVDTFYAIVLVEDDSPIERVSADLYDMSADRLTFTTTILGVETDTPGVFELAIPAPTPGDSLAYRFQARDIYHNVSVLPETSYRFFHLKVELDYILGDVVQDGRVDIFDLVRLGQIIIGEPPTEEELIRADINRDGLVDIYDLKSLMDYYWPGLDILSSW